jgi:hypothetical protein
MLPRTGGKQLAHQEFDAALVSLSSTWRLADDKELQAHESTGGQVVGNAKLPAAVVVPQGILRISQ